MNHRYSVCMYIETLQTWPQPCACGYEGTYTHSMGKHAWLTNEKLETHCVKNHRVYTHYNTGPHYMHACYQRSSAVHNERAYKLVQCAAFSWKRLKASLKREEHLFLFTWDSLALVVRWSTCSCGSLKHTSSCGSLKHLLLWFAEAH